MKRVTLARLPVSPGTRSNLLNEPRVTGAVVTDDPDVGEIQVHVFGPSLPLLNLREAKERVPGIVWVWERGAPTPEIEKQGRTACALHALDEDPQLTPYAAAHYAGVDTSAVYRALSRREAKAKAPKCPCCGRPLAAAQKVAECAS